MRIKRHLIYTCVNIEVSRMYGGCDYTVRVWEVVRKGVLRWLGEATRCNRGHRGSLHEAWNVALQDKVIARAAKKDGFNGCYFDYLNGKQKGWEINAIGTTVD